MAKFWKWQAANKIEEQGVIPLFYSPDSDLAIKVTEAIFNGGSKILEFTNRGENALQVFDALIKYIRENHPEAMIGVGSINDVELAAAYLLKGADFVVGPSYSSDVQKLCNRNQVLYIPGCATTTEILSAAECGAEIIKIFPASQLGGAEYLKALRGPLPWLKVIPTGGVSATAEELKNWYKNGAVAVGLGSDLVSKTDMADENFESIENKTKALLDLAQECK